MTITPQTVAALAERYKKAVSDAAFYAGTPSGQDRELNALRDQLIAAQAAEIERLRVGLSDLIDHVEAINSEWDANALQEARQALEGTTP